MQRLIVSLIVLVALITGIGGYVHWQNQRHARALAELQHAKASIAAYQQEARLLQQALAEAEHAERVITQYVDRVRTVRERGHTLIQEIPVYVTQASDAACTVPAGFVRLHDDAAQNLPPTAPASDPAGNPDAPAPGIALSDIARAVADNYTTCHATAAQLTALQDWLRGIETTTEGSDE